MARNKDVDPAAAVKLLREGKATLLDVREPDEWALGHADGAQHLPLGALNPASVPDDLPVIAVCRSGRRSGLAADRLAASHSAYNLEGGMLAWAASGLPVHTDDGSPGKVN